MYWLAKGRQITPTNPTKMRVREKKLSRQQQLPTSLYRLIDIELNCFCYFFPLIFNRVD